MHKKKIQLERKNNNSFSILSSPSALLFLSTIAHLQSSSFIKFLQINTCIHDTHLPMIYDLSKLKLMEIEPPPLPVVESKFPKPQFQFS
jgi:hypothetical protein